MRGNGLTAEDYAPLADVARSVTADALLALRDAGVAAYAVLPEPGADGADRGEPADPYPSDPSGQSHAARLFVDRTALDRARAVLQDLVPGTVATPQPPQVDEVAWQQIVSGFSATATEPDRRDRHGPGPSPDRAVADPPPQDVPHPLVRDDDHFVPEPPPPPPDLDLVSRAAWAGVFGGPLFLLLAALLSWVPPATVSALCVLGFVGGMVVLVLRMRDRPPTDDGPDNGAVV